MGDWKLGYHTDNTYAKVTNNGAIVINNPITEIEKDSSGNKYDSYNEFNSSVLDFFVKAPGGSGEASWGGVSGNIEDQEDLTNALDSKVDNSKVLTDVPEGAIFTDTVTTINGKTGVITKADIVALGIPAQDTVYVHPGGTNPHGTTKGDVGLGNVDNTSDLNKPISTAVSTALNGKANTSDIPVLIEGDGIIIDVSSNEHTINVDLDNALEIAAGNLIDITEDSGVITISAKIELVEELPAIPTEGVVYFVKE